MIRDEIMKKKLLTLDERKAFAAAYTKIIHDRRWTWHFLHRVYEIEIAKREAIDYMKA